MIIAAGSGHIRIVSHLIDLGGSIDCAIELAALENHSDIQVVSLLLSAGSDIPKGLGLKNDALKMLVEPWLHTEVGRALKKVGIQKHAKMFWDKRMKRLVKKA